MPGVLAQERARVRECREVPATLAQLPETCITEASLWTGFLVICIFSYLENAEKEVLKDLAQRRCLEMFVALSRRWVRGLPFRLTEQEEQWA